MLPQEIVDLAVSILTKLRYDGHFLIAQHDSLADLLSHLHGSSTTLFLRFFTLTLLFSASLHPINHILIVFNLALYRLPKHPFVIIHDLIELLPILICTHCLFQIILELEFIESIRVEIVRVKLIETGPGDLPVVHDLRRLLDHVGIVEFGWRLHNAGVVDVEPCELGAQRIREFEGIV